MLNTATKENLRRKSAYVDAVQLKDGIPMFSWVDLSLTEICNRSAGHPRACKFCPRIDPAFYPNQNLHMSLRLVESIADQLEALDYQGVVVLCGYGEPLLHPDVAQIVRTLKTVPKMRVELVTNGDFLGPLRMRELAKAGLDFFVVSMYDGEHQVSKFKDAFEAACIPPDQYLLRDRWHSEEDQFGLKLTNRAGVVTVGPQDPIPGSSSLSPCYYPTYQLQVDWNGDVLLCPQDWHKRLRFGNLNQDSLWDVWSSKRLHKRRQQLMQGRRCEHPCSSCNTDGTLHGHNHANAWLQK